MTLPLYFAESIGLCKMHANLSPIMTEKIQTAQLTSTKAVEKIMDYVRINKPILDLFSMSRYLDPKLQFNI